MNLRLKSLLLFTVLFVLCFALIDLKNALNNGAPFIVDEDVLDQVKHVLTLPGMLLGFLIASTVYQNVHNYSFYVVESIAIGTTSLLYGWIGSLIYVKLRRPKKELNGQ